MVRIPLPQHIDDIPGQEAGRRLPSTRECVIVGGNGAGKSLFFQNVFDSAPEPKSLISVIDDAFPVKVSPRLNSIASLLAKQTNADKLTKVAAIWGNLFPGSSMETTVNGRRQLTFHSPGGSDSYPVSRLSRGEKAALHILASAVLAPEGAILFVDSPTLFLHPTVGPAVWDKILLLRSDCRIVYDTNDPLFAASRRRASMVWVRSYRPLNKAWDYRLVSENDPPSDDLTLELLGSRRPVLFIEGDATHSIDYRLYSAAFPEYTVRPVGSCDKVIESVRAFTTLRQMHHLESRGIVDRDRRSGSEVDYLRRKGIMVPEVAEIENIFLSPGVVREMAVIRKRNPDKVLDKLGREIIREFDRRLEEQALQHTRHRMKRDVERKIDARFTCITALELHIKSLVNRLQPREHYNRVAKRFRRLLSEKDIEGILQIFNHKPLLTQSCAIPLLGFKSHEGYIEEVLKVMRRKGAEGERMREAVRQIFIARREAVILDGPPQGNSSPRKTK